MAANSAGYPRILETGIPSIDTREPWEYDRQRYKQRNEAEKFLDRTFFTGEQVANMLGGAISYSHLNNFGRMSTEETSMEEIRVFGNDDETLLQSQLPNGFIVIAG
jgi:hypothetical protein